MRSLVFSFSTMLLVILGCFANGTHLYNPCATGVATAVDIIVNLAD